MHDALPAGRCPFSWSAAGRLRRARERAVRGVIDPAEWHPDHQGLSIEAALALLADIPPVDELVVCHGDSCAPNTLITDDGRWSGHVDLGDLGVADRWADLAIATWSTTWNYGPGWEIPLLDAYGIAPDPDRTRYYRLLWDISPAGSRMSCHASTRWTRSAPSCSRRATSASRSSVWMSRCMRAGPSPSFCVSSQNSWPCSAAPWYSGKANCGSGWPSAAAAVRHLPVVVAGGNVDDDLDQPAEVCHRINIRPGGHGPAGPGRRLLLGVVPGW